MALAETITPKNTIKYIWWRRKDRESVTFTDLFCSTCSFKQSLSSSGNIKQLINLNIYLENMDAYLDSVLFEPILCFDAEDYHNLLSKPFDH